MWQIMWLSGLPMPHLFEQHCAGFAPGPGRGGHTFVCSDAALLRCVNLLC